MKEQKLSKKLINQIISGELPPNLSRELWVTNVLEAMKINRRYCVLDTEEYKASMRLSRVNPRSLSINAYYFGRIAQAGLVWATPGQGTDVMEDTYDLEKFLLWKERKDAWMYGYLLGINFNKTTGKKLTAYSRSDLNSYVNSLLGNGYQTAIIAGAGL